MKNGMRLMLLLAAAVLLSSCASMINEKVVFDDSVPLENSTWILPGNNIGEVIGYNGIPVDWDSGLFGLVRIPAGDTLLEWNINGLVMSTNITLKGQGILFQYNFQPQKKYLLILDKEDDVYGMKVYSYQYEEKFSNTWKDMEEHLDTFVAFLNVGGNGGKTILN
jgi:hypothetical protein